MKIIDFKVHDILCRGKEQDKNEKTTLQVEKMRLILLP